MSLVSRIDLPGMIERGRDTAITLDVYSAASAQQTASAAVLDVYAGTEKVVDGASATGLGPPATYTVTAATTTSRALSSDWLAVWTLTIGGNDYIFRQPLYLVRHLLYPVVIDTDLTDERSDLDSLRNSAAMATFEPVRELAWSRIQRRLIARGNRPALVMDPWALKDLHVYETLAILYADFASSLGDSRYRDDAEHYRARAAEAWDTLVFRYDEDEDGVIDGDETRSGSPVVYLSRPHWEPRRWRR